MTGHQEEKRGNSFMPACCLQEAEPVAFCDNLCQGGAQGYLGLHVRDLPFTLSSERSHSHLTAGKAEAHLPKCNSCDEIKKAKRVHDVPQVGEVTDPVHVPLQHREGQREDVSSVEASPASSFAGVHTSFSSSSQRCAERARASRCSRGLGSKVIAGAVTPVLLTKSAVLENEPPETHRPWAAPMRQGTGTVCASVSPSARVAGTGHGFSGESMSGPQWDDEGKGSPSEDCIWPVSAIHTLDSVDSRAVTNASFNHLLSTRLLRAHRVEHTCARLLGLKTGDQAQC